MKTKILILIFLFAINFAHAQFDDSDVSLTVTGLSEQNSKKFKENKQAFMEALNKSGLPIDIKPLKIEVNYKNNTGYVKLTINFNVEKIYAVNSGYIGNGYLSKSLGKGISFRFHKQLMLCLSNYKFAVAKDGFSLNTDIANFGSVLILKKPTGDIMTVYAYNRLNNGYGNGGIYPCYIQSNIDMKIGGKMYSTSCGNNKSLVDLEMFFVNDLEDLNGAKTGAYYFCKFYNIPTN